MGRAHSATAGTRRPYFEQNMSRNRTRMNAPSIFDLSPSEKLQLVEVLWDDIAADPEAVPIHDRQKLELAERKANLSANPASVPSWDEVRRAWFARTTPIDLVFAPEAEKDIAEAYSWYEGRRAGFGRGVSQFSQRFLRTNPPLAPNPRRGLRQLSSRTNPQVSLRIFYEEADGTVRIYGVLHTARDPQKWRQRLA